jgi:phage terminase Nu1 subunit (DNA packaging protein)
MQVNGISQAALGRAIGISPPMVTKLKGQGMPVHSVEAALAWRDKNQRPYAKPTGPAPVAVRAVHDGEVPDFKVSRARREAADADKAEMEAAKMRGELVPAAEVRAEFAKALASIRDGLLNLPGRMAPVLAAQSDARLVQAALDSELRALLGALAG